MLLETIAAELDTISRELQAGRGDGAYVVYRYTNIGDGDWQNQGLYSKSMAKTERARLKRRAEQAGYDIEVKLIPVDSSDPSGYKEELRKLDLWPPR